MKKNKIIFAALVVVSAVGSAYAVKTSNTFAATVYEKTPSGYELTTCDLVSFLSCIPTTVTAPNTFFLYNPSTGIYSALPVGTPLKQGR